MATTNVKDADWSVVEQLPTEKTAEQKEKRQALFSTFDPNGNGYLSLAEVDKGT
jgi:Ca2+-binding EF-hand superfamily protein